MFAIDLTDETRGEAVHTLLQPAELRLNLAALPDAPRQSPHLTLLHFDATVGRWEEVTSYRDGDELVAAVSRFSYYGLSNNLGHDWHPSASVTNGGVSLFTGAAAFSIPLAVPQGTAGLAPQFTLGYSSLASDQINETIIRSNSPADNQSATTQADWVGLGWSLSLPRITSEVEDWLTAAPPPYSIELNGVHGRLFCVSTTGCDNANTTTLEYKTEVDSFARILRKTGGPTAQAGGYGVYFEVWTKTGAYYRFGYTTDAEHLRGQQHHASAWGLALDRAQDQSGNRMEVTYFEDQAQISGDTRPYSRAAYPALIKYTFNDSAFGSGVYRREVRFNASRWVSGSPTDWGSPNRTDWSDGGVTGKYYYVQRYRLDEITSYLKLTAGDQPFRKYSFTYDYATPTWQGYTPAQSKLRLTEIREWAGTNFAASLYAGAASYTLAYSTPRLQLSQVQTALGGAVNYAYQTFLTDSMDLEISSFQRNRVTSQTLNPGAGLDPAVTTSYSYSTTGRYDDTRHSFVGHDWTQVADALGHAVVHYFFTTADVIDSFAGITRFAPDMPWLKGLEYRTDWVYPQTDGTAEGNKTKRVVANDARVVGSGDARAVERVKTVVHHDPGLGSAGLKDLTTYSYGAYGNVTAEFACPNRTTDINNACDATGGYTRKTQRWFGVLNQADTGAPGGYRYIVDRVIKQGVTGAGQAWPTFTYYSYDTDTAAAGPLTKGQLWWVRQEEGATCDPTNGCTPTSTVDVKTEYDSVGNVFKVTTFDAFGQNGAVQTTGGRVTETQYDSQLKTFVTKVIQPKPSLWAEAAYDDAALRKERPTWVRDANDGVGNDTEIYFEHDDFGRILKVARPGDTLAAPTETYEYILNAADPKLLIKVTQRLDATRLAVSRTFYDGAGRALLTKNPSPSGVAGETQAVAAFYDNRGVKTSETIPYVGTDDNTFSRNTTVARVTYAPGTLGQDSVTTAPDGTTTITTALAATRLGHTAARGTTVTLSNPSVETASATTLSCTNEAGQSRALPQSWTTWATFAQGTGGTAATACAQRSTAGHDGRFALWISSGKADRLTTQAMIDNTWAEVASNRHTVAANTVYTASWLARARLGTGKFRFVIKEYDAANALVREQVAADASGTTQLGLEEWRLYHFTFQTAANTASTAITFRVGNGGYDLGGTYGYRGAWVEVDGVRLTSGPVTETSVKADGLGRQVRGEERQGLYDRVKTDTEYDLLDRPTKTIDHSGNQTTTTYGTRFRTVTVVDPDRGTWTSEHNASGTVKKITDPRPGQWVEYTYDELNRLTGKLYPSGAGLQNVAFTYDTTALGSNQLGRRSTMTFGVSGQSTESVTYRYDTLGRLASGVRLAAGGTYTTTYQYSGQLLTAVTYPDGEVVTHGYGSTAALTSVSGQSAYLSAATYDVQGRPLDVTLGNGAYTRHTYDATTQRLSSLETWVKNAAGTAVKDAGFGYGYDTFGNLTALTDSVTPADNRTFTYDNLNRLLQTSGPYAQTLSYDALGNILTRDGQGYTYGAGKPHAVSHLSSSGVQRFSYDAAGNMTTRGSQTLEYDVEGRLKKVTGAAGTEEYSYDGDGAVYRRKSTPVAGSTQFSDGFASQNNQAWAYNTTYQTVPYTVDGRDTVQSRGRGAYVFDHYRLGTIADGQVARVSFKLETSGTSLLLALDNNDGGQLSRFALRESGGKLYLRVITPSQGQLLPAVILESIAIGTWYRAELAVDDASGFRAAVWPEASPGERHEVRYEMPTGKSWTFTPWLWAGTMYLDSYEEVRPSAPSTDLVLIGKHYEKDLASSVVTKRYYAGSRLLASRTGTSLHYIQPDHLGSATTITDPSGQVVARERYSAFGERRRGEEPKLTENLYTDQRYSSLVGFYHYSDGTSPGRFYDPLLARYLQADPLTPGGSQGLNRYAYVVNNPLRHTDPTGNRPEESKSGGRERLLIGKGEQVVEPYWLDLTRWFVNMANWAVGTPEVQQMAWLNWAADNNLLWIGETWKMAARWMFAQLVQPGGVWDFKGRIYWQLGTVIRFGDSWMFYDVLGNIFFGFIGRAAGFTADELHQGAGVAQLMDWARKWFPSHGFSYPPGFLYGFDYPEDWYAIEVGIDLYDFLMSRRGFLDEQTVTGFIQNHPWLNNLNRPPLPPAWTYFPAISNYWPYTIHWFDGYKDPWPRQWFPTWR